MKNSPRQKRFWSFVIAFIALVSGQDAVSAQTNSPAVNRQLETWRTFAPEGKNFKVSLPAKPRQLDSDETKAVVSAINKNLNKTGYEPPFTEKFAVYELQTRWAEYGILVLDYKWQHLDYDHASSTLTLSSDQISGDLFLREWLQFEKAKALSNGAFVVENNGLVETKYQRTRALVTKNKVIIMYVVTPDLRSATGELAKVYQAESDKFFNSLHIFENKTQVAKDVKR